MTQQLTTINNRIAPGEGGTGRRGEPEALPTRAVHRPLFRRYLKKEVFAPAQAETLKRDDIDAVVIRLNVLITVPVTQNQFDALCSLVFTIGIGEFTASTLLNIINEGDATGAAAEFPKWCYASIDSKHAPLPGLIKRRQEEKALFKPGE
ncbi:lysozyme [Sodalis praecaptivus]|uniref:lysozyme n=1 Tax=Sodalis TaxID=84565 RepID=UPI00046D962B|nr:lysozyme [Sodalis praecaptivus]